MANESWVQVLVIHAAWGVLEQNKVSQNLSAVVFISSAANMPSEDSKSRNYTISSMPEVMAAVFPNIYSFRSLSSLLSINTPPPHLRPSTPPHHLQQNSLSHCKQLARLTTDEHQQRSPARCELQTGCAKLLCSPSSL